MDDEIRAEIEGESGPVTDRSQGDVRWTKAIPQSRDRLQSSVLVWIAVPILCYLTVETLLSVAPWGKIHFVAVVGHYDSSYLATIPVSVLFALVAWRLRAATSLAAFCGGMICLLIMSLTRVPGTIVNSGLTPLILLFVLTFEATRLGRQRKAAAGLAESRKGRSAAQIIANLGVAAFFGSHWGWNIIDRFAYIGGQWDIYKLLGMAYIPMLAGLAEVTADTVSSEIGQAFGGTPRMILTLRRVPPGTDGAITPLGTLAGITAAAIVVASAIPTMGITRNDFLIAWGAGVVGLFFDSLLGATVEPKGWIGNDLVNLLSTAFSATVGLIAIHNLRLWLLN